MAKSKGILPPRRYWTEVEERLLREHYADTLTADLATALGRPPAAVSRKALAMGLRKTHEFKSEIARDRTSDPSHPARQYVFAKGFVPANKGAKRGRGWAPGRMADGQFKPGNKPQTWVPVGTERINSYGVLERKVSETPGPDQLRWRPVVRLVWEQAHGPVPAGHVVRFKDGRKPADPADRTAYVLDALECIHRRDLMARNTVHNLPRELVEIVQARGALTRVISTRIKKEASDGQDHQ